MKLKKPVKPSPRSLSPLKPIAETPKIELTAPEVVCEPLPVLVVEEIPVSTIPNTVTLGAAD
jgi:hypothetical protein